MCGTPANNGTPGGIFNIDHGITNVQVDVQGAEMRASCTRSQGVVRETRERGVFSRREGNRNKDAAQACGAPAKVFRALCVLRGLIYSL